MINHILVGVLFSGENEYDECLSSINTQTYKNFELLQFEHLPKFEAHRQLYHAFLDQKEDYDLLIKIDADMVLTRPQLFEQIVQKFDQNPQIDVLAIAILDFFSGGFINGLNTYRNTVRWELDPENVNADVVIVDKERFIYDQVDLAPAAYHCKNPSKLQAFHFGVHRGIKIFAPKHSTGHWRTLEKTRENFLRTGDIRLGLAVLGAELVYAGEFSKEDENYSSQKLGSVLKKYESMDAKKINREIIKLRLLHFGFLPSDMRRKSLRFFKRKTYNSLNSK